MYHLVSYDLAVPGQDYPRIIGRLEALGSVRVMWSTWAVYDSRSQQALFEDLARYVDFNDRLLVTGINGWWGVNLMARPAAA
jgi:uncharacterized protein (DUF427 family)